MSLMAIHFNQSKVAPVASADGIERQSLLNKQRVPGILFELDRLTVQPGGHTTLETAPRELDFARPALRGSHAVRPGGICRPSDKAQCREQRRRTRPYGTQKTEKQPLAR